ncbi:AraC-like DNA-binding protein [Lipingzhangella halophila]|uniref:AraC-like DNA-binding protein n=1 Tax=Lipingzhangella halophila TaxID=1783352 RepID=A0A7W7RCU3_9ACTN|nr:helix-turn-helix domain-containing protein [Lipingzhangella halophila]MBB4929574.1 AraC-like DNA-binding protein [Lipingzhangella halophila]
MLPTLPERATQPVTSFVAHTFDDWQRRMSARFVRLRLSTDRPEGFHGRVLGRDFNGISLARISARAHEVARLPSLISAEERRYVKFSLQLRGSSLVAQDGREAVLGAGDMAVYDTGRPYRVVCGDDAENLVVVFPAETLTLPATALSTVTAARITGSRGVGSVVGSLFRQLGDSLHTLPDSTGTRLVHQAVDLVDTLLRTELEPRAGRGEPAYGVLAQVKQYIEENLGDPTLGPANIARAHSISVRYLHSLFESEGATVSTSIKRRRLERCRRDLLDPANREATVTAIASRWGFVESAHFSRVFKQRFGVPPSAYRSRYAG